MTDRSPKLDAESFNCPRCNAFAHQKWTWLWIEPDEGNFEVFADEKLPPTDSYFSPAKARKFQWSSSNCHSCNMSTVWRGSTMIFPATEKPSISPHPDMTQASSELFSEAVEVLPISRRAAAALARAAMELELRHLLTDQRSNLHDLIGKLSGGVSEDLWHLLTVLRDTGNKALHGGSNGVVEILLDDSDAELAPFLLSAVNQIVDEKVARPKRAKALYDTLPEGVREAAERKRIEHADLNTQDPDPVAPAVS